MMIGMRRHSNSSRWGAVLASGILALALATACSDEAASGQPCTEAVNGTLLVDTPAAEAPAETSRNLSTNPEVATGYRSDMTAVRTATYAAATANPFATKTACEVLRDGGTAADALIAAQMVLGLVEPQSSGIGGGAFALYYDGASGSVEAYDGRETAPAAATPDYLQYIDETNHAEPLPDARASGRSIGTPGVLRLLELAHEEHGKVGWNELFDPAITLADQGFEISPRLAAALADAAPQLARNAEARDYFLEPDGQPKPAGAVLTNPAYSKTLNAISADGAEAFYTGAIADAIVDASASTADGTTPGKLSLADLAGYQAKKRTALCTDYRDYEICGMPNPSSGGLAVASTLGILENFPLADLRPTAVDRNGGEPTVEGVHLIAEAERLAYADRDKYVADSDFVPLPGNSPDALVDKGYLTGRAGLISPDRSMGIAAPGVFDVPPMGSLMAPEHGTSHISVADSYGNVAVMTTTVESAFGSFHMTDGFILNNQLTDFAANPTSEDGLPVANRLEPGKRPRSSMAPTLVFDQAADGSRGGVYMAVGSPGGSVIIQFVVKTLVGVLDWGLDPQQAVSMVDFGAANSPKTNVGGEHPNIGAADDALVKGLTEKGHQVVTEDQSSGLSALVRTDDGWIGGADPRREGAVMGDTPAP